MPSVKFPSLSSALSQLNRKRAEGGSAPIQESKWSAFLSGINGASVKKAWVSSLLAGEAIPLVKALAVLSGVNAALKQAGLTTLSADVLVETEDA